MENFSELIKNRRSMRKFTDEELTQDEVVTLMKAALMSPSSKRSNSWQFVVIDDKEMLKELSHCKEQASSFIADAVLAIVVMADPLASDVWIEDAAIASIMIQLQAEDLGLGSCWVQVRERFTATGMPSDEFVHGILDIPLQLQVLSVIAVGHKGMERKPFKANNSKDTYLATAVTFMVIGALFLIDKLIHFSSIGLPWVMNKDNMLLYAAACFLIFKRDKSIGLVLLGLWLVMNIGLVMSLLGSLSGYLLPLTLLIIGIILYWFAKR